MSKKKKSGDDDFHFYENMTVEEFLEERNRYLAKLYHKLADKSYKEKCKESNSAFEPITKGVSYATTSDYSHS